MQLTLSIAITQVPMSVALMQVLRFYCNYVCGTFCYNYVGGSFCCNYTGDCFCCSYAVRSFCSIYAGDNFCNNFYWNYARGSLCCNHEGGIFCSGLCTCAYITTTETVTCIITIEIVMYDYFYCNYAGDCFCCSYICDSFKSQLYSPFSNWYTFFIKLTRKHQKVECIKSNLHFTPLVNILPKLRYIVGRIYIKVSQKIHSVLLLSQQTYKRWGHLGFLERGESENRVGWPRKGVGVGVRGMTPLTNYDLLVTVIKDAF